MERGLALGYISLCFGLAMLKGPLQIGNWIAWPMALLCVAVLLFILVREVRSESHDERGDLGQ
jgi:4-hydroxybenzoate polyprenyltransferase